MAVGFVGELTGDVSNGTHLVVDDRLGAVTGPPHHSMTLIGAEDTLVEEDLGPGFGVVPIFQAAGITTTADATSTTSTASAQVTGAQISTPMGVLVIDALSAQVSCEMGRAPSVSFGPAPTITLNGNAVAVDPAQPTVITYDSTTDPDGPPGTATLTLTLEPRTVRSADAIATAFNFALEEDLTGIVVASGTMSLAQVACASPAAPTSSSPPATSGSTVSATGTTATSTSTPTGNPTTSSSSSAGPTVSTSTWSLLPGSTGDPLPPSGAAGGLVWTLGGVGIFLGGILIFWPRRRADGHA